MEVMEMDVAKLPGTAAQGFNEYVGYAGNGRKVDVVAAPDTGNSLVGRYENRGLH